MSCVVTQFKKKKQDARNSKIAKKNGTMRSRGQETMGNSKTSTLNNSCRKELRKEGVSRCFALDKEQTKATKEHSVIQIQKTGSHSGGKYKRISETWSPRNNESPG
mmetsp:Transcript_43201/g.60604  ORF Transcript_43201/g.60604 Transcript_43201/m.60604 type:complete len:106 (-) Transcript_43201:152-469(-)